MSGACVPFELFSGFASTAPAMPDGVGLLDAAARSSLVAGAMVRHAAQMDCSVAYGVLAARAALDTSGGATGILALNGPWNVAAAVEYDNRARVAGAQFINPMRFPATLVSQVPTRIAQELGCKQFAYAVGHDRAAFAHAVRLASRLVDAGYAETVLVVATCHGAAPLGRIAELAGLPAALLDVALCARVGKPSGKGIPLALAWNEASSARDTKLQAPIRPCTPWIEAIDGEPLLAAFAVSAAQVGKSGRTAWLDRSGADPRGDTAGPAYWSVSLRS